MPQGYLLTGATGSLGSYLLRDGLRAADRMAVLARPHRMASARERVAAILGSHASNGSCNGRLPDPVVLSGDLTRDNLDLDAAGVDWISRNCHSLIHTAASLQFDGPDPQGEPWRTNVEGTRRVLDLCRATGIKHLHYVSTAYVCGLRSGQVMEDELDLGQAMGNDYERSKLEAERLVRDASFFESVTIYRPAIVVGDSKTGHTTGYHGFYSVLKLAHTLVRRVELGATNGRELTALMGLGNDESKHLVPVDWVSAVITRIRRTPCLYGRTYHLTAQQPTRITDMAAVVQEAVERYSLLADGDDPSRRDGRWFARVFREQMDVYGAYLRDDPQFDPTNARWAAPDLPCPLVDRDMLIMMARRAIQSRFGRAAKPLSQRHSPAWQHTRSLPVTA